MSAQNNSKSSEGINLPQPYRPGENPATDAWFTTFYIENHLDYFTHPDQAATPEQIRFMVYTAEDER